MTNEEITKAIIDTAALAGGGIMNAKQAAAFIKMVFDQQALLPIVRTVIMPRATMELDKVGVGQRIMRGMTENEDMSAYTVKTNYGKINLAAKKYALPYELSEDMLEDNIEGKKHATTIAQLFATQMGLDMEDTAVNGDTVAPTATTLNGDVDGTSDPVDIVVDAIATFPRTSEAGWLLCQSEYLSYEYYDVGTKTFHNCARAQNGSTIATHADGTALTWSSHPLIGNDDGWLKQMYDGAANYIDLSAINGGEIAKGHFFQLFRAIPRKYTRGANKARLRWLMSSMQYSKWLEYLTDRNTGAGDAALLGRDFSPLGIKPVEVPSLPDDTMGLTYPKNLIVGFWRQIKVRMTAVDKESIFADKRFYNSTVRWDFRIEELEAVSYGDGLKID